MTSVSDSARTYSFVANAGTEYAVLFDVTTGSGILVVIDSATNTVLTSVFASDADQGRWTANFSGAGVLLVRVQSVAQNTAPPFRLFIQSINRAPESRLARFTVGDTVTDAIDLVPDVDTFVAHGDAGQELVGWIEALNSTGVFEVNIIVLDPASGQSLGGTFHGPNDPNPHLAVLPPLPASSDYTFRVPALRQSGFPEYVGPYRFRFYAINRAPETATATMPEGVIVSNEALDIGGDIDEFTFPAAAGDQFNAFIRSASGFPISMAPLGQTQGGGATVTEAADTSLFAHGTGRFRALAAGNLRLRVRGQEFRNAVGPYELYLYHVDPNPETAPAALTPGDTVATESIDLPGDLDEFSFTGSAGDQFNLFFSPLDPIAAPGMIATVRTPTDSVIALTQSANPPADFWGVSTDRFELPSSGTYHIRVDGAVGRYRLFLYPVNAAPETLPSTFALGDSMSGEAIDVPGDVDEYHVSVSDTTGANLAVELVSPMLGSGVLSAWLVDSTTGQAITVQSMGAPDVRAASGRVRVPPGTYILRVISSGTFRGSYRIWLYSFSFGPETIPDTFAIDDTVSGESIEPWGDADIFHFYGVRGSHVNFQFQGLASEGTSIFTAWLRPPNSYPFEAAILYSSTAAAAASLADHQTGRLDLPSTGWYEVSISGPNNSIGERGPYRFAILREDSLPEHMSGALVPGDTVGSESIDTPGDWDQFLVSATPGQELGIVFDGKDATVEPFLLVRALNAVNNDSLAGTIGQFTRFVGPFTVPADGQVKIAVFESVGFNRACGDATCGGAFQFVGPYGFKVIGVNRAPEAGSATYAVGDTVRGEAIDPIGDFDEFIANATPGQVLHAYLRTPVAPVPAGSGLTLEVIDPTTSTSLVGSNIQIFGPQFNDLGSFTVPSSGNLLVRVRGTGTFGVDITTGPYEFVIKP